MIAVISLSINIAAVAAILQHYCSDIAANSVLYRWVTIVEE